MSLYNLLFGVNQDADELLKMLGLTPKKGLVLGMNNVEKILSNS